MQAVNRTKEGISVSLIYIWVSSGYCYNVKNLYVFKALVIIVNQTYFYRDKLELILNVSLNKHVFNHKLLIYTALTASK